MTVTHYSGAMSILQGRVALVTGAQQGIGRAIAEAVGREGASVVVQYLDDQDTAEHIAETIRSSGSEAHVVQGDVGVRSDCAKAFEVGISPCVHLNVIIF